MTDMLAALLESLLVCSCQQVRNFYRCCDAFLQGQEIFFSVVRNGVFDLLSQINVDGGVFVRFFSFLVVSGQDIVEGLTRVSVCLK